MKWTDDEWQGFCALLEAGWPGEFDEADRKAWRILLDDVAPRQVVVALKKLIHAGTHWRPSVSELLAAVREDPSTPTFEEMLGLIYRAACRYGPERVAWLRGRNPLVASFVELQGPDRIFLAEYDDPEWGQQRRRELRESWERFLASSEKREVAALASGGGREGLRRLDPLAGITSIEAGRAQLPADIEEPAA